MRDRSEPDAEGLFGLAGTLQEARFPGQQWPYAGPGLEGPSGRHQEQRGGIGPHVAVQGDARWAGSRHGELEGHPLQGREGHHEGFRDGRADQDENQDSQPVG